MKNRFFFIYLSSALVFLFSCNGFLTLESKERSSLADKQRISILETIKNHYNGDSEKIARVDKYFDRLEDSQRDVVLQLFSAGFDYINSKESANRRANLDALKSNFESKLKQLNYTEEDFNKLVDDFNEFVDPKPTS
ncbi:hypothetical protein [Borreliella afzelii]|uniref:hypothetical protein n=1 Tax=Borreliella afzelii TaxID=29518 RepID=UPI0004E84BEF|nr:hypothetical protein [Borreliella afzelii]AIK19195.1 hypothetical protein P612_04715 [Borreliella afzelii Tom3107]